MAPSSTETRVGFESWCKDRYYFLKTKKTTEYFPSQTFISGTAGRNIGKFFRPGYRKFRILVIFVKTVKIMKTSSLMMCALVALTACGTGVKQSVRTPVEMGERIELKTPDPKMGLTINEALAARSSSRDFSPEMLSGGTFGCTVGCCRGKPGGWASYRAFGYGALSHSGLCFPA